MAEVVPEQKLGPLSLDMYHIALLGARYSGFLFMDDLTVSQSLEMAACYSCIVIANADVDVRRNGSVSRRGLNAL